MPITIFHTNSGSTEKWLEVNDDGTVTYYERMFAVGEFPTGMEPRKRSMTSEEAKSDWNCYADDIDEASAKIALRLARQSSWF